MSDGCFLQASGVKNCRWASRCSERLPSSGGLLQVIVTTPWTCQVMINTHAHKQTNTPTHTHRHTTVNPGECFITVITAAGTINTALLHTSNRWQSLSNLQSSNSAFYLVASVHSKWSRLNSGRTRQKWQPRRLRYMGSCIFTHYTCDLNASLFQAVRLQRGGRCCKSVTSEICCK